MSNVTPLKDFQRRVPEAGRLRFGIKTERAMKALETWRVTSRDESQIRLIAERYGGEPRRWEPGRGRSEWEVVTTSTTLEVIVPPPHVALGGTPVYEMWTAAGLQRRCDGETLSVATQTPDGAIVFEQPCICANKGLMDCKPITRLNVMLPDVPFTGMWMMEAKGWNAAKELPGMVDMVFTIQEHGFARALLRLERRTKTENGRTSHFVVPVLSTPATLDQLAQGGARLISIASGAPAALSAGGAPADPVAESDDAVVEAEVVEEDESTVLLRTVYGHVQTLDLTAPLLQGLAFAVSDGEVEDVRRLNATQLRRVVVAMEKAISGNGVLVLDGRRTVLRRRSAS
jgi:hypothetical protein